MAYTPPAGNSIAFSWIVAVAYVPPAFNAIALDFPYVGPPARVRRVGTVTAPWAAPAPAAATDCRTESRIQAVIPVDRSAWALWFAPAPACQAATAAAWGGVRQQDVGLDTPWTALIGGPDVRFISLWGELIAVDHALAARLGSGAAQDRQIGLRMHGSRRVDADRLVRWHGRCLPGVGAIPIFPFLIYSPSSQSQVDFSARRLIIDWRTASPSLPMSGNALGFSWQGAPSHPSLRAITQSAPWAADFVTANAHRQIDDLTICRPAWRDVQTVATVPVSHHADRHARVPWSRYARRLDAGVVIIVPPETVVTSPDGTILVPVRSVYLMSHSATLTLADATPLDVFGALTIATDADSWCWTLSATLPASELSLVEPISGDPVEVIATINDQPWRFVIERIARTRSFGKASITLQGRSRSAWLAAPYAAATNRASAVDITAQQIIASALPTGWTLDWQLTDWLVPAGVWSHHGTPIEVAQTVADAAGAILQTNAINEILQLSPRYSALPWALSEATPYMQLPMSLATTEGVEFQDRAIYNRVYVSGENQGIVGRVTRTGTAGDLVAPMVADLLTTHADAARQRGGRILAESGRMAITTLTTPFSPDLGLDVAYPGKIIEVTEGAAAWRGYVRGLSITFDRPGARQIITLERPIT